MQPFLRRYHSFCVVSFVFLLLSMDDLQQIEE
jgi:hypothetical protein